ncbi:hypothetical protein AVEN_85447-1 [Araneus ventricosus]|uniref:Uncharacterized protein n=1 Tax=Araneus ventricosus TaxID=182803 RepID=A0A4Y2GUY7_ARAVE|nr:hypothetical protein AVEN_85447-1 [Araneus ventricosus]
MLAKQATLNGSPYPDGELPWSHIEIHYRKLMMDSWEKQWEEGETGRLIFNIIPNVKIRPSPWRREEITFFTGHGPFGGVGSNLHYAIECLLTESWHLRRPEPQLEKYLVPKGRILPTLQE